MRCRQLAVKAELRRDEVLGIEFLYMYVPIKVLDGNGVELLSGSRNVVCRWDWRSFSW